MTALYRENLTTPEILAIAKEYCTKFATDHRSMAATVETPLGQATIWRAFTFAGRNVIKTDRVHFHLRNHDGEVFTEGKQKADGTFSLAVSPWVRVYRKDVES